MLSITSSQFSISREPEGLRELEHRVYYSSELRGYLEEFNGDLTFYGDDYTYLRRQYITGACSVIPVVVTDSCGLTLNGNLFLNDAEWRPDICSVKLQVVDGGFLSLIDQNMGIKAYVNVPRSKNDVDITSYVSVQTDLEFKSNTASGTSATNRSGVRVYDALKMLIGFMTDGLLGFESDFLYPDDDDDDVRIPVLVTADELRTGSGDYFPYISFEELFTDVSSLYNLTFSVQNGVFRVEQDSYFKQSTTPSSFQYPEKVEQRSDEKSFVQKVMFGSQIDENEDFDYYPNITFLGFRQEEYHMGGQCNTKATLDLQLTTITTDPNIIMANLPNASGGGVDFTGKNEDIYMVTFGSDNISVRYQHPVTSTLRYYNDLLTNFRVATRWGDGVPFPIYLFLGADQNGARAIMVLNYLPTYVQVLPTILSATYLTFPLTYPPFGFDPNLNISYSTSTFDLNTVTPLTPIINTYSAGNTIYTAPVSSIYTVSFMVRVADTFGGITGVSVCRFGSSSSAILEQQMFQNWAFINGAYQCTNSYTLNANIGDRIAIRVIGGLDILSDSFFQVNGLDFITKTYNPYNTYLVETAFEIPMGSQDWQTFLADRNGRISVTHKNGTIRGYLKDVTRNLESGMADWTIRSTFGDS